MIYQPALKPIGRTVLPSYIDWEKALPVYRKYMRGSHIRWCDVPLISAEDLDGIAQFKQSGERVYLCQMPGGWFNKSSWKPLYSVEGNMIMKHSHTKLAAMVMSTVLNTETPLSGILYFDRLVFRWAG